MTENENTSAETPAETPAPAPAPDEATTPPEVARVRITYDDPSAIDALNLAGLWLEGRLEEVHPGIACVSFEKADGARFTVTISGPIFDRAQHRLNVGDSVLVQARLYEGTASVAVVQGQSFNPKA